MTNCKLTSIKATIDIAQSFNLTIIAEGVETPEQLRELMALDCELAKGYLWSQPVEAEKVVEVMEGVSTTLTVAMMSVTDAGETTSLSLT